MDPPVKSRSITIAICAALLAAFAILSWLAASQKGPTYDEPLHLVSAWMTARGLDYRCDPEDPPLWKFWAVAGSKHPSVDLRLPGAQAMLNLPTREFSFTNDVLFAPGNNVDALLGPARARMLVIGALLGAAISFWAWKLGGGAAAVVATALYALDPNFMAHAALVKNDMAMSLALLAGAYAIWRIGQRITWRNSVGAGLALGAALTTKFSGVLLVPMFAALLAARALNGDSWPAIQRTLSSRTQRLLAAAAVWFASMLIAWGIIWLCYAGRFAPAKDGATFDLKAEIDMARQNEALLRQHATERPSLPRLIELGNLQPIGWKLHAMQWIDHHHLLPQAWIVGFLYTYANSLFRSTFLLNERSMVGWWYYFPLAMLFKTPLATIAAIGFAAVVAIAMRNNRLVGSAPRTIAEEGKETVRDADPAKCAGSWTALCLIIPPAFLLASAMLSHLNLGLRHVLSLYPFMFIGIGMAIAKAWQHKPRATTIISAILVAGLLTENLLAFPNYIPFFNAAAGGSRGGLALLSDSNLDWGQDLPLLAAWQRAHPDVDLMLCYFGGADPRYYGIHYINLRGSDAPADLILATHRKAVLAISASNLQGTYLTTEDRLRYAKLKDQQPIAVLGGSIYLFDIKAE